MMPITLLKEYGLEEFNNRVIGASVNYNNSTCMTLAFDRAAGGVTAYQLNGTAEKINGKEIVIPIEFFTGLACLRHPQLGYRSAAAGQYLVYMSRIPTAVRKGFNCKQLMQSVSPMTRMLSRVTGFNAEYYMSAEVSSWLAFNPNIVDVNEGLARINKGEILSYVVDENFAVVPSDNEHDYLYILYRERLVGTMTKDGVVTFHSAQARRAWDQVIETRSKNREAQ